MVIIISWIWMQKFTFNLFANRRFSLPQDSMITVPFKWFYSSTMPAYKQTNFLCNGFSYNSISVKKTRDKAHITAILITFCIEKFIAQFMVMTSKKKMKITKQKKNTNKRPNQQSMIRRLTGEHDAHDTNGANRAKRTQSMDIRIRIRILQQEFCIYLYIYLEKICCCYSFA